MDAVLALSAKLAAVQPPTAKLDNAGANDLAARLAAILPKSIRRATVLACVDPFKLDPPRPVDWEIFLCKLAGNLPALAKGVPVRRWEYQRRNEWVPCRISYIRSFRRRDGQARHAAGVCFFGGMPAGETFQYVWSSDMCLHLAKVAGFHKPERLTSSILYDYPQQLVRLRFSADLTTRPGPSPQVREWAADAAMRKANRTLLGKRLRLSDDFQCPRGHPAHVACRACPAGYDTCPAAVRPAGIAEALCAKCGKPALLDPTAGNNLCLSCSFIL